MNGKDMTETAMKFLEAAYSALHAAYWQTDDPEYLEFKLPILELREKLRNKLNEGDKHEARG